MSETDSPGTAPNDDTSTYGHVPFCGPCGSLETLMVRQDGKWVCPNQANHKRFVVAYELEGEVEIEAVDEETAKEGLLEAFTVSDLANSGEWTTTARVKDPADKTRRMGA